LLSFAFFFANFLFCDIRKQVMTDVLTM